MRRCRFYEPLRGYSCGPVIKVLFLPGLKPLFVRHGPFLVPRLLAPTCFLFIFGNHPFLTGHAAQNEPLLVHQPVPVIHAEFDHLHIVNGSRETLGIAPEPGDIIDPHDVGYVGQLDMGENIAWQQGNVEHPKALVRPVLDWKKHRDFETLDSVGDNHFLAQFRPDGIPTRPRRPG